MNWLNKLVPMAAHLSTSHPESKHLTNDSRVTGTPQVDNVDRRRRHSLFMWMILYSIECIHHPPADMQKEEKEALECAGESEIDLE